MFQNPYFKNMMIALSITILSELLILLLWKEKRKSLYFISIIMNIITNVSFNFILLYVPIQHENILIFLLEVGIVIIEMLGYQILYNNLKKSFTISLLANLASYIIGMILMPFVY